MVNSVISTDDFLQTTCSFIFVSSMAQIYRRCDRRTFQAGSLDIRAARATIHSQYSQRRSTVRTGSWRKQCQLRMKELKTTYRSSKTSQSFRVTIVTLLSRSLAELGSRARRPCWQMNCVLSTPSGRGTSAGWNSHCFHERTK